MKQKQEQNKKTSVWKRLWPFVRPYRRRIVAVGLLMSVAAVVDVILPLMLRHALNTYVPTGDLSGLIPFGLVLAFLVTLSGASVILFIRLATRIETGLNRDLRQTLFDHLQRLSLSYYNATPVGYMLARVMSDTARVGELLAWSLVDLAWAVIYLIGAAVSMLVLNAQLAVIVLLAVPPIAVITGLFRRKMLKLTRVTRKLNSEMTGVINEGITGARTAKILAVEQQQSATFQTSTEKLKRASVHLGTYNAALLPIILFLGAMASAFVLWSGGHDVVLGVLELGTLAAFISYAGGVFEPISSIARVLADITSTQVNIERITAMLDEQPGITDSPEVEAVYGDMIHPKTENWESIEGSVDFDDVTFRYPDGGGDVLTHFSLHIPAGTFVALVGETGAGKSTLVNLVCRFYEPSEGRVMLDGRDLRERSQLWLHRQIGYVLQNPHLFSGTVADNIRYGRLDATEEELWRAARLVSADKVIERLPDGMSTQVGEGGDRLSTGEKQLISFARAVLSDPKLFVLDEATSSVDTETEALIHNATRALLNGRTSFVVAHRLSTVREADIILVVDDGQIIERGTHDELLARRGRYRELYTQESIDELERW